MYYLYEPYCNLNELDETLSLTVRLLYKIVLGYTDDEFKILEAEYFMRNVANNLTLEQAKTISEVFLANKVHLLLNQTERSINIIDWADVGITLDKSTANKYHYDKPLITPEQKSDTSIPKRILHPTKPVTFTPKTLNTITCPYCHSTKTKKISTASKVAHTAVFGVFSISRNSKQWHCNGCGSDF